MMKCKVGSGVHLCYTFIVLYAMAMYQFILNLLTIKYRFVIRGWDGIKPEENINKDLRTEALPTEKCFIED